MLRASDIVIPIGTDTSWTTLYSPANKIEATGNSNLGHTLLIVAAVLVVVAILAWLADPDSPLSICIGAFAGITGLVALVNLNTTPGTAMTHIKDSEWHKFSDDRSNFGKLFGVDNNYPVPAEYNYLYVSKDAAKKAATAINNEFSTPGAIAVHKYTSDNTVCVGTDTDDGTPCNPMSSVSSEAPRMSAIAPTLQSRFHITPLTTGAITQLHGQDNILKAVRNGTTFKDKSGHLVNCGVDYTTTSTNTGGIKNITIHAVYCLNGSNVSQINAS